MQWIYCKTFEPMVFYFFPFIRPEFTSNDCFFIYLVINKVKRFRDFIIS